MSKQNPSFDVEYATYRDPALASSPRPLRENLSCPIVVVPSGRCAASRDPPGRVRAAESGTGVRTPLDRSAGRTLILAGCTQRKASWIRCRGRRCTVHA